jgi:hypothetical protein
MRERVFISLTLASIFVLGGFCQAETFSEYADKAGLVGIESMSITYVETRGGKSSIDTVDYSIGDRIEIVGVQEGELANGRYTVEFKPDLSPSFTEFRYKSNLEKTDFWETYSFETPNKVLWTDRASGRTKQLVSKKAFGDMLSLYEFLVFLDTDRMRAIKMSGVVSPNAVQLGFECRLTGRETIKGTDGTEYRCLVYDVELDNLLSLIVKLFYGNARIWIMEDFPHLRVKMDFFHKISLIRSFEVVRRPPLAAGGAPRPSP